MIAAQPGAVLYSYPANEPCGARIMQPESRREIPDAVQEKLPLLLLRGAVQRDASLAQALLEMRQPQLFEPHAGVRGAAAGRGWGAGGAADDSAPAGDAGPARRLCRSQGDLAGGRGARGTGRDRVGD